MAPFSPHHAGNPACPTGGVDVRRSCREALPTICYIMGIFSEALISAVIDDLLGHSGDHDGTLSRSQAETFFVVETQRSDRLNEIPKQGVLSGERPSQIGTDGTQAPNPYLCLTRGDTSAIRNIHTGATLEHEDKRVAIVAAR